MKHTLYFYDLETSGISPKNSRIMQFAGQRTDMDLKPQGEPDNCLIKITPDVLPEPDAVLITGITPQKSLQEGISEAEFLKLFYGKIALAGTVFVGFNNIRFDDEFIRYLNYRNFYDPYEWHYKDERSRWDLLDATRMTRALRPDGISWPYAPDGKPSNRLELLASINDLLHSKAHDALSDVEATIAVAGLLKTIQPKIFNYLLEMRDKKRVKELVSKPEAFVYTSGRYSSESEKTTIAVTIADHPTQKGAVLVYDLTVVPYEYLKMTIDQLAEKIYSRFDSKDEKFPVKVLQFNRCPAVAPLKVLDEESKKRLKFNIQKVENHLNEILNNPDFSKNIKEAYLKSEKKKQSSFLIDIKDVDGQLYEGFFGETDQEKMEIVRNSNINDLADLNPEFNDNRLKQLLLLYKARQIPQSITQQEQTAWEEYRQQKLISGGENSLINKYFKRLEELSQKDSLTQNEQYLLEELRLYGESLIPY